MFTLHSVRKRWSVYKSEFAFVQLSVYLSDDDEEDDDEGEEEDGVERKDRNATVADFNLSTANGEHKCVYFPPTKILLFRPSLRHCTCSVITMVLQSKLFSMMITVAFCLSIIITYLI